MAGHSARKRQALSSARVLSLRAAPAATYRRVMRRRVAALSSLLALVLASPGTPSAGTHPPALRGVIEGYYGRPWTGDARRDVIRFLGAHRLTTFVYAPKNDDFHRTRWREPYPAAALTDLERTARTARRARSARPGRAPRRARPRPAARRTR